MYSPKSKNYKNLINYNLIILVIFFFSFGNFGFLNLFFDRLLMQIVLLLIVTLISSMLIINNINYLHIFIQDKLLLFLISFSVLSVFYQTINLTLLYALFLIITLYCLNESQRNFIIKGIIVICSLFSIMAIVQFVIIHINPSIVNSLEQSFSSSTGNDMLYSNNALDYLGFIVHNKTTMLFEYEVFRSKSFATEPSILVYLFVAPGILALSYSKIIKIISIPIFLFILFIASSGTIYLSIGLGLFIYFLRYFLPNKPKILSMLLIVSIIFSLFIISKIDPKVFVLTSVNSVTSYEEVKTSSAIKRVGAINTTVKNLLDSPFEIIKDPDSDNMPLGFFLKVFIKSGLLGLFMSIFLFYYIFLYAIKILIYSNFKLFSALSLGMFVQVFSFSSYGWFGLAGILMLGLYYLRIKDLSK
jgi:hypothetical protein